MGLFKNVLLGAAAAKLFARTNRPTVIAPEGFQVVGLKHGGFGSNWTVTFISEKKPNLKEHFKVTKSTKSMTVRGSTFEVYWPE